MVIRLRCRKQIRDLSRGQKVTAKFKNGFSSTLKLVLSTIVPLGVLYFSIWNLYFGIWSPYFGIWRAPENTEIGNL